MDSRTVSRPRVAQIRTCRLGYSHRRSRRHVVNSDRLIASGLNVLRARVADLEIAFAAMAGERDASRGTTDVASPDLVAVPE